MSDKALVVWGGWEGHQPKEVGEIFANLLTEEGFLTTVSHELDAFLDASQYKLLVPIVTMSTISREQVMAVWNAVENGMGMAGCHGGMGDAFRECCEWQFMVGGQFVAHPGDQIRHTVNIDDHDHPLTKGVSDFEVLSEMYYMHVDPAIQVLATCQFPLSPGPHAANGKVSMPVVWTKLFGKGRVFYCSLGHDADVVRIPQVTEMMRRGFLWASHRL